MSESFSRDHVKISVAKILQTLGWHSINTTPLEVLTDLMAKYIRQISKTSADFACQFGHTEPNLDHLALAFRDMGVNLPELEEYVTNVNFGPPPNPVPKYPIHRDNHLNFLKPGSKEMLTRPVHIHEHLPPMYPLLEESDSDRDTMGKKEASDPRCGDNAQVFKKPADVSPIEFKRPRREEEGSRPTREISSVMMTTSGFLSPAREGKLPESRTPIVPIMDPIAPSTSSFMSSSSTATASEPTPFIKTTNRKADKKKDKVYKELFKHFPDEKPAKQKTPSMKDVVKMKQKNNGAFSGNHEGRTNSGNSSARGNHNKVNKTLAAARLKTEKLNTTITPIPLHKSEPHPPNNVGKLLTEPDKKKVNIFKKISNVKKEEKHETKAHKKVEDTRSRGSSPDLIIDEPDDIVNKMNIPSDITIEPIHPTMFHKSPDKSDLSYFDDGSPPGTPSTPKTPELISHSPPITKEKRKRKDSKRVRKIQKHQPPPMETDVMDSDMERPKTPEAHVQFKQEFPRMPPMAPGLNPQMPFGLFANFGGPGLIPNPFNPIFPFSQKHSYLPPGNNIPSMLPSTSMPYSFPPIKKEDSPPPPPVKPKQEHVEFPSAEESLFKPDKKAKEHKKEKKDKIKKKNKKDKIKNKAEKKKLKEEKKDKIKKEKKEKKKEKDKEQLRDDESPVPKLFLKLESVSPRPETPDTIKKLNIKPILKKEEEAQEERKRETSPGLAKISALVTGPPKPKNIAAPPLTAPEDVSHEEITPVSVPIRNGPGPGRPRIHPIKTKPTPKPKKRRTSIKKDDKGNEVWICPACGKQDDGSPMIGCDGCDAWYHWVCVGIQVPPDDNENWYCRHCLTKKNEDLQSDKKKKRKKKEKKDH